MFYDFCGRLKKEFPSQVIIDITEKCNFSCIHCPHSQLAQSGAYKGRDLSLEIVQSVVDEIGKYGEGYCQQIRFASDGEPFLNLKVFDMLKYAVEKSNTFVSITTNGSTLTKENIQKLLSTGVSLVDISIDAFSEEAYNKIRIGGNFSRVVEGVNNLLKAKKELASETRVVVSFVKQPLNQHEVDSFKNYWENQGVDFVIIRDLHTAGGAKNDNEISLCEKNRRPCVYPWERISLNPRGEYEFCPDSWEGKAVIGTYAENKIHELWSSDEYAKLRDMHLNNCFEKDHMCESCTDWMGTAWPGSDRRGYGDMISDFSKKR